MDHERLDLLRERAASVSHSYKLSIAHNLQRIWSDVLEEPLPLITKSRSASRMKIHARAGEEATITTSSLSHAIRAMFASRLSL